VKPRPQRAALTADELDALAGALAERVSGPIATGHCTGTEAFAHLARAPGVRLSGCHAGERLVVGAVPPGVSA